MTAKQLKAARKAFLKSYRVAPFNGKRKGKKK